MELGLWISELERDNQETYDVLGKRFGVWGNFTIAVKGTPQDIANGFVAYESQKDITYSLLPIKKKIVYRNDSTNVCVQFWDVPVEGKFESDRLRDLGYTMSIMINPGSKPGSTKRVKDIILDTAKEAISALSYLKEAKLSIRCESSAGNNSDPDKSRYIIF